MTPRQKSKDRPLEDCVQLPKASDIFHIFKKKEDKSCGTPNVQFPTQQIKDAAVDYIKGKVFGK